MPISPHLLKGAIVSLDPNLGVPLSTIAFQYNPDEVTRTLKPQSVGEEADRSEVLRLKGPPTETMNIEAEMMLVTSMEFSGQERNRNASQPMPWLIVLRTQ